MPDRFSSRRTFKSAIEWLLVALLAIDLAWTTMCLGGYRAEVMVLTSALNGALLIVYLLGRVFGASGTPLVSTASAPGRSTSASNSVQVSASHPAGWWLLPFLIYAAINALMVSPVRWLAWHDWLFWAQMIAVFWVVLNGVESRSAQTVLIAALVSIAAVSVGMACYQRFVQPEWLMLGRTQAGQYSGRASGSFGAPNNLAALILMLLPVTAAAALRRGINVFARMICAGLAVFLAIGLVLTISRGAWLGLILALSSWPLFMGGRSWRRRLGMGAAILAFALAICAGLYFAAPKVRARIDALVRDSGERSRPILWRAAGRIFLEHPATGGGAGSFNILFERYRPEGFHDEPEWAHNEYLNTLSDYGGIGFLLFFGAVAVIVWRCFRARASNEGEAADARQWRGLLYLPACAIGLLAFAFQLAVDFHLKIPALAMTFAIIAALVVQHFWPPLPVTAAPRPWIRNLCLLGACGVVAGVVLFVRPHYRAEGVRYAARRTIDRLALEAVSKEAEESIIEHARAAFREATEIDPGNSQAWADRAYGDALASRFHLERSEALGSEAESFARRALAGAPIASEYWLRLGVALDMRGRWAEGSVAFAEALRLAPAVAQSWYYQAYHFSLRAASRPLARAAVATCLRLDPGNREAEALRQRLAVSR
jgi:O-antigen ligase